MENFKAKICYISSVDITIKFILFDQIKFLKREGYNVYVVCSPGKWIKDIEKEKIKVKTIKIKRKISPISDLIAFVKLFFYFKKEKFDIVHTHTQKPALLGQLAAKMAGVPIIVNTILGLYFQERDSWLKRTFFILIEKIAARCSDLIFSINRENIETIAKENICPSKKIKYLGGWVDISRFNPSNFSDEFILSKKKELGIPSQTKIIGIVARLVKEKGYFDLFNAFSRVLKQFPNTILLIIGPEEPEKKDGFNPDIISKYHLEKNAIFFGERTDVNELYSLMDIFVLPSHREGIGISILEASAMKKPIISTNIRGCREAVDNGKTGILVPAKNSEKLAEAIVYLLLNPEKAKEMGKKGREKILKEFDERIIFNRIKREYQCLIKEKISK